MKLIVAFRNFANAPKNIKLGMEKEDGEEEEEVERKKKGVLRITEQ
jgi:hypothetical protein